MIMNLIAALRRESGQDLAEYSLVIALIALVCIMAVTAFGTSVSGLIGSLPSGL